MRCTWGNGGECLVVFGTGRGAARAFFSAVVVFQRFSEGNERWWPPPTTLDRQAGPTLVSRIAGNADWLAVPRAHRTTSCAQRLDVRLASLRWRSWPARRLRENPGFVHPLAKARGEYVRAERHGGGIDLPLVTQDDTAHVEAARGKWGGFAWGERGQRRERGGDDGASIRGGGRHRAKNPKRREAINARERTPETTSDVQRSPRAREGVTRITHRVDSPPMMTSVWLTALPRVC